MIDLEVEFCLKDESSITDLENVRVRHRGFPTADRFKRGKSIFFLNIQGKSKV